ncbi:MAG: DUF1905 domain-containing protein [Microlunatus sp.]|nr:DUF1905 domain-containing protein [Microlunatus sp.]
MEYTGVLESTGGNTAAFVIPDAFVEALDSGRRPKVKVAVNGKVFHTSIAKMGGPYWLGISKARREEAGLTVGESYTLEIEPDTEERTVDLPDDLAAALAGDRKALESWERLSFTNKREIAESISSAKRPETRDRRIAKAAERLRAG